MELKSFNDICIVPSIISRVEHRGQCKSYDDYGMLPLFTAPMSSVVNESNWQEFIKNKINTIIPRNVDLDIRITLHHQCWIALSLSEAEELFINNDQNTCDDEWHICIDIANGHMLKLLVLCDKIKSKYKDKVIIMTGNIANPATYLEYAKVGIDYIRCGIGSGNVCTTSANVGVHYPMASLIQRVSDFKQMVLSDIQKNGVWENAWDNTVDEVRRIQHVSQYKSVPKIIADGGFNNFDQIIKALALGADYVMIGKLFAMSEEACGDVVYKDQLNLDKINFDVFSDEEKTIFESSGLSNAYIYKSTKVPYRRYYGMSTKEAQKEFGNEKFKTSEGIEKLVPIQYTLFKWCDNFISYLRSTMSYCNSFTLSEFSHNAIIKEISNNSFNAYYK